MGEQVRSIPGTIIWMAPFYNRSGFGIAARTIVSSLHRAGISVRIASVNQVEPGIDDCDMALIKSLESTPVIPPVTFIVSHLPGKGLLDIKLPEPNVRILATTVFDSSVAGATSAEMLAICRQMDQVWLHVAGEREAFIAAGFPHDKVQHVPWPHHWLENPLLPPVRPEPEGADRRFRFLNISMFLPRRRWDTLIEAYLEEFGHVENVELYLKANYPFWHPVRGKPRQDLLELIGAMRKKTRSEAAIILDDELGARTDIVNLVDSCNAYISTDTAPTVPISEARARRRLVIIPEDFKYGEIGISIPVDPGAGKVRLTREMLLYEPNHKGGSLPRLHVRDVREAMRRAYEMPVYKRQDLAARALNLPGPSDALPHITKAIDRAWRKKMPSMFSLPKQALPQAIIDRAKGSRYKPGISAVVHTLNAANRVEGALESLKGWVDEIIVCDMRSEDRTVEIASSNRARVIHHDGGGGLNAARNFSATHASHEWVFYLDADQRVPAKLAAILRKIVDRKPDFDALTIPVDEHWYGRRLKIHEAKWPFFKSPQLLRNGCFRFPDAPHQPPVIRGGVVVLNGDRAESESAIVHYPWDGIEHWMSRMNELTNEEAQRLDAAGARFRWKDAVSEFVNEFIDWHHPRGNEDGALGFGVCFNFANHAFYRRVKLFERHLLNNDLQPGEETGPESFVQFFEYMLEVARQREKRMKGEAERFSNIEVLRTTSRAEQSSPPRSCASAPASFPALIWEGSQFVRHSLAGVNRELCLQLLDRGVALSVIPYEPDEFAPAKGSKLAWISECINVSLPAGPVVHVRHTWPPNFQIPSHDGHLVLIQPWEYGRIPEDWVEPMSTLVDEIWTPSRHSQKSFVASGVPVERVHVVPNGVDTALFHPGAAPCGLETKKKFRFLFVGGTIWRKGIDLLLAAYCEVFRRRDDVVLVIKDMGQDSFYKGQGVGEVIGRIQNEPLAPEVAYLTEKMDERSMPGLYTACDCLVHPYRGEGFGLPVLEAMVCGVPVITTEGGSTDDFCPPGEVFLIPSERREFTPQNTRLAGGAGWVLEPDLNGLKSLMVEAFEKRAEAKERALGLCERIRRQYGWQVVAERVMERLGRLSSKPVRRSPRF